MEKTRHYKNINENSIDIKSTEYPSLLKKIKDPPSKLFYRGLWNPEIFTETLSVVGSRKMTGYGEVITERLITDISAQGITIVSGFMYGIDAEAHKSALDSGGITIAVMPCGIMRIHPAVQEKLYNRILNNNGLVISEYEGDMQPARWTFPRRNRIIAGLSPALLVIEAGIRSGALITANYANKYTRKIFAVPGPLTSSVSQGTANLLKNGADIVTGSDDILNFYGRFILTDSVKENQDIPVNPESAYILKLLSYEALSIDDIARKASKPVSETGADITKLLISKYIQQKGGLYYLNSGVSKC